MSIINSQPLIGASGNQSTAYNLTRSLRFRSSASTYLNRSQDSGDRQKWTISFWVKRGLLGSGTYMFYSTGGSSSGNTYAQFYFYNDQINYIDGTAGTGNNIYLTTTQVFRDPSAWYHIVISADTTQATASNRVKIYVNGSQVTAFANSTYPSQNYNTRISDTTAPNASEISAGGGFDGYLAEWHNIDGQQLDASSFGETDTATGVWKPKKYTGTYGTNGFYLKFDNLTSTSTLGNDSSGNSNTWTVNNISLTSGSTYDSMKDVPTLTDADTANYAVLNPLQTPATVKFANLGFAGGGDDWYPIVGTIGVSSGKWYWEVIYNANFTYGMTGIAPATYVPTKGTYPGSTATSYGYHSSAGNKYNNGSGTSYGASYTGGDVIGVALDMDAGTLTFYKNNSSQGTAYSSLSGTFVPAIAAYVDCTVNFGQQPFAYTPPSGFKALNTFNLPTPTIGATASNQAGKYFNPVLYTGNASGASVTGVGFQPDFVWMKSRGGARNHELLDAVRGGSSTLFSNLTNAEATDQRISAFSSDGFTYTTNSNSANAGEAFVAWNWKANGAGSSNTAGTISSTVSANTTAGFSIVTYTGNGSTGATVGHGLGVAPNMIIAKCRGAVTSWPVYHSSLGATSWILLNSTNAATTSAQEWNNTAPTSTVFTIGSSSANSNQSATYVAYCFAEVAGYSKFGSHTGNGSSDGVFIYTGFRPKFVMFKRTDSTEDWIIVDTARNTYNVVNSYLLPSSSGAEASTTLYDLVSNGIKIRGTNQNINGATYIHMAFAESPFKYSLAR